MGLPTLEEAVVCLVKYGIRADIGNPGGVMPHLGTPIVAVNTKEASVDKKTLVACVCGSQANGQTACESVASRVALNWMNEGAECTWGDYSFDSKCAMHIVKVYGTWTNTEEA